MKMLLSRPDLAALIGKIQGIVASKPTLPILANVLLEAMADQLIITVTDLNISMRAYMEAKVEEEGSITLPAKRLFQLIRELTTSHVEIHAATPEVAFVNAGSSHFKLQGMHKSEFPSFPDLAQGLSFTMPVVKLKAMLTRSSFAAAREDERQTLTGICLYSSQEGLTLIATDGKRLAKLEEKFPLSAPQLQSHILPLKTVDEIVKILDSKEETVKLTLAPDKIGVEVGNIFLISKLISGQYPDVARVIPEPSGHPLILHREELMTLLRQVAVFTSDLSSAVRFTFTPGELHLAAMSGDIGEGKVSMPVNYNGSKLEIAFSPHYFLDILRHSGEETIHLDVTDSYNPGLITDSSKALFMLMPMRLEE